jgi:hypothetical protein
MIANLYAKNKEDFQTLIRSDCVAAMFIDAKELDSVSIYLKGSTLPIKLVLHSKEKAQQFIKNWNNYLENESV